LINERKKKKDKGNISEATRLVPPRSEHVAMRSQMSVRN